MNVKKTKEQKSTLTDLSLSYSEPESASLLAKINQLEIDLERRSESYVSREHAYKSRVEELEEELRNSKQNKTGLLKSDSKMKKLKHIQHQIINNVELVQDRTARILQEQERDLLRAFRARLFDVQSELEKEKSKKDDGAGVWIDNYHKLEAELDWSKEVAERLERVNQSLLQENSKLKTQFQSQEQDREFLIKQLVTVKKDNAKLRAEVTAAQTDIEKIKEKISISSEDVVRRAQLLNPPKHNNNNHYVGTKDLESRYRDHNLRLKRQLNEERKGLAALRASYSQELRSRTELEGMLRQCLQDVRKEIARKQIEHSQFGSYSSSSSSPATAAASSRPHSSSGRGAGKGTGGGTKTTLLGSGGGTGGGTGARALLFGVPPVEDFTAKDREKVLELLLSQERVLTLLYARTFPVSLSNASQSQAQGQGQGLGAPHLGLSRPGTSLGLGLDGGGGIGGAGRGLSESDLDAFLPSDPLLSSSLPNSRPSTSGLNSPTLESKLPPLGGSSSY